MAKKKFLWCAVFMTVLAVCFGLAACADKGSSGSQTGSETGEYYFEPESGEEYLLTLNEDGSAALSAGTEMSGSYTISGKTITLTFEQGDAEALVISAVYENGTVTLTYNDAEMRFLEKIYYTVTFETNGGTAIDSVQVLNGKTLAEPEGEPSRTNYEFLGWYKDGAGSEPFDFAAEKITANTTVYAKWAHTNTITYDSGSGAGGSITVKEGEPYALPVPDADYGYLFIGWHTENGDRLTDGNGESLKAWDPSEYGNITVYARYEADLEYTPTSDGSGYSVAGKTTSAELENLVIPETHEGKPVVDVGSFAGYAKLKKVSIPSSVKEIAEMAFADSPVLADMEIYSAAGITDPAYVSEEGVLFNAEMSELVLYPVAREGTSYTVPATVTKIAANAFRDVVSGGEYNPSYSGALTEIILPRNLQTIGEYAFYKRGKLKTVKFAGGESLAEWSVGDYAFYGAPVASFDFNDNLTSIGAFAFYSGYPYSSALTEVVFTENSKLTSIGDSAFYSARTIQTVVIPPRLTYLGQMAFFCAGISTLRFSEGCRLETINYRTFYQNLSLTTLTLPASVKTVGEEAFANCQKLAAINFSEGLTEIGRQGFYYCKATELVFPETLKTIGAEAFMSSSSLQNITLNEGLLSIGDKAFYMGGQTGGIALNIPSTVQTFGNALFSDTKPITEITIDNQRFLDSLTDQSWFNAVDSVKVNAGLEIPEVFSLFADTEAEGYISYDLDAENIVVEEQSVLDSAAQTAWFLSLDAFKIKEDLQVPERIAAFEQGADGGYKIYTKERVRADDQSVLDFVAAASWLSSVNVIEAKNDLAVPSAITQSYTLVSEGEYNVYIKGIVTAESQQFLDYILNCDWSPAAEVLKVNEALTISETYNAFKQGATDGYSIYTKEKITVDTQEFLDKAANGTWLSSVNVLSVKDGLLIPQKIADEFEAAVSEDTGYQTYYRTEITAVSNEFLASIQNESWVPNVTLLKVRSGVRVLGNLYSFSQGTLDGYTYYTAEKATISGKAFMESAAEKEWISAVNVLAIHYTFEIPEELTEGFISVGYNSSYYYFVRADMRVFSQAFLNYVSAQTWLTTNVESLTVQNGLTIPSQISENYTAGETVDGYTIYTRKAS